MRPMEYSERGIGHLQLIANRNWYNNYWHETISTEGCIHSLH